MKETEGNSKEPKNPDKIEDKLLFTITAITWIAAIAAFGAIITNNMGTALFVAFTIAFITGFLLKPLITLFRKGRESLISFREKCIFGLRGYIVFIGILCGYMVFASPYYDLYWSYWGLLFSFLFLALMDFFKKKDDIEEVDEEEKKPKSRFRKVKKIAYFAFTILLTIPNFHQIYTSKEVITLEDLVLPAYIQAREIDKMEATHGRGAFAFREYEYIYIREDEVIDGFIEELEGITVENLRYIQELNYSKMKRVEAPYYQLYVYYGEEGVNIFSDTRNNEGNPNNKRKYIYALEIFPNGRAYIELVTVGKRRFQMFPVDLSEQVIQRMLGSSIF